ncbi:MAG: YraN family protein [Planctomycetota bacterium]|nr:YraN family protein [Planctomycetota bacterium]
MRLLKRRSGHGRRVVGRRGERLAARHLRRAGYRILHRNLTIGRDEADLIALDPDRRTVVIVEVKTRTGDYLAPEVNINRSKRYRLMRFAGKLAKMKPYADRPMRFDAVAICWPPSGAPEVRHYVSAFESVV